MVIMEVFPSTLRLGLMTRRYVHFSACFHKIVQRHDMNTMFRGPFNLASSYYSFALVTLHLYSVSNQSYLHIDYISAVPALHLHGIWWVASRHSSGLDSHLTMCGGRPHSLDGIIETTYENSLPKVETVCIYCGLCAGGDQCTNVCYSNSIYELIKHF